MGSPESRVQGQGSSTVRGPQSIRARLLLWHGVTSALLIAASGAVLVWQVRRATLKGADAEVTALAQAVLSSVEGRHVAPVGLRDGRYYVVWAPDGAVLATSTGAPDVRKPTKPGGRESGRKRERVMIAPDGTIVVAGRDIRPEQKRLRSLGFATLGIGAALLAVMLVGGRVLIGRSLAPVGQIGRIAREIGASRLDARIPLEGTPAELMDVTIALNDAFARLESSFRQQLRFTADAAHELRTPIAVLAAAVELALARERTAPDYREALETCSRAIARLRSLTEGLMMLARADAGRLVLERSPLDLKALASEVVVLLTPLARQAGTRIEVDAVRVDVDGDRDALASAVGNLVANAIRHNGAEPVVVRVRSEEEAILTVEDSGAGIPEAARERIFDRFFRSDEARSRDHGGAGLGLPIAKAVVEAHGGRISFRPREGGKTVFEIRLPRSKKACAG